MTSTLATSTTTTAAPSPDAPETPGDVDLSNLPVPRSLRVTIRPLSTRLRPESAAARNRWNRSTRARVFGG